MRLDEITKEEFLDELRSPELAQAKAWARELKAKLLGNWKVEVAKAPVDFYADYYINVTLLDDSITETDLVDVVKIASDIIPVWSFYQYFVGHETDLINNVDVQIDIAYGRKDLYQGLSNAELEKRKYKYNWKD